MIEYFDETNLNSPRAFSCNIRLPPNSTLSETIQVKKKFLSFNFYQFKN
jgi:hypothetical protein